MPFVTVTMSLSFSLFFLSTVYPIHAKMNTSWQEHRYKQTYAFVWGEKSRSNCKICTHSAVQCPHHLINVFTEVTLYTMRNYVDSVNNRKII